uniref:Putative Cloroperoxidase n=1 Tax=Moniliophthora roreri TaxID=221103 RepID=A0A0W0GAB7_MONRR
MSLSSWFLVILSQRFRLANHGYLPRNGQNITISMILQAAFDGYHIEPSALILPAKVGLITSSEPETLTLDDLKRHGVIEHDASISREDFALGDNLHFNEAVFETMANANPGSDVYNITSAARVLQVRLADSLARNPNVTNSETEFTNRILEGATYLSVMGDASTGVAPKNFVQIFFREERLPIEEGWKRSSSPITLASLFQLANLIAQESHWNATNECPTNPLDALNA